MTDLLIGGSGFVGRNLARRLAARGRDVVVLDRVPDSTRTFDGECVLGDAQDVDLLIELLERVRPETVYHLAANSDIQAGVTNAALDFGDTLMTTVSLRSALSAQPVERLVFASSSAIFGVSMRPLAETTAEPPAPVSWYGKAKLTSEFVLESLAASQPDLPILIVRFPNVVGPLATHGVVYDFVRRLRVDPTRLEVLGDGNQTKPYVHVDELIDGISFFLKDLPPGIRRVNIGPMDATDVKTIVREVTGTMGLNPEVTYQDSPCGWPGDVPRYSFDTSKMRREGFAIDTTSQEAVRRAAADLVAEMAE